MTPMKAATKLKEALVKQYGEENTGELALWDKAKCEQMGYGNAEAALIWEGGPCEWAVELSMTEAVLNMPGILAEPYNSFILNFYTL